MIVAIWAIRRRATTLERLTQRRHRRARFARNRGNLVIRLDCAVHHPVQHVLDRPGQFTDDVRANDAAAAFQRVERATHFGERFFVRELRRPLRQPLVDALQNFAYFLDEDFENVVVDVGRCIRFLEHGCLAP